MVSGPQTGGNPMIFKYDPEYLRKKKLNNYLSNGYRFAVIRDGEIVDVFRYKYQADRLKDRKTKIVQIEDLI